MCVFFSFLLLRLLLCVHDRVYFYWTNETVVHQEAPNSVLRLIYERVLHGANERRARHERLSCQ